MSNTKNSLADAVCWALSEARMSTYTNALCSADSPCEAALELYAWNSAVSAAFLTPLHICEVVIRNAVSDALESIYGERWPWSPVFLRSLPDPQYAYSPRRVLLSATRTLLSTGKAIPELNFVFWQNMFTSRHDKRIWDAHLLNILPGLEPLAPVSESRLSIYNDLQQIRLLRNRIAHHEPIFKRDLSNDYARILTLIRYRCPITADWLERNQQVTTVLTSKPTTRA